MKVDKTVKAVAKPALLIGGSSALYEIGNAVQAMGKDMDSKTGFLVSLAGRSIQILAGVPSLMAVSSIVKSFETKKTEET